MQMSKTIDEKIETYETEILQRKNQIKQLIQKRDEQERKARTHRLIERGAILESLIDGAEIFTMEQIKELLNRTVGSTYGAKIIDEIKARNSEISVLQAEIKTTEDS